MRSKGIGYAYANVSTNTLVKSGPCKYYGGLVINKTTGGVTAFVYDATATASGTCIDILRVTSGTNNDANRVWGGIACNKGIYISAVICTSASDQIIVFHGGL